ncbi:MarR family winged helix-turn-helix transcriptional regulator [Microbacterium sp.]|uniref:MarR family winged helix-turn-helix transcriptional regulator n=1 Tax=Microbacterium sp. TaxID=51671 RepID=UPI0039E3FF77
MKESPLEDGPSPDESRTLARLIVQVADRARDRFTTAIEPLGLPVPIARTVLLLTHPMPLREIADQLGCDPSYVTTLADRLEDRGLARRVTGEDRRVKLLEPTPAGLELQKRIAAAVGGSAAFARQLPAADRQVLSALLERLLED